jgi:hypothetical protein
MAATPLKINIFIFRGRFMAICSGLRLVVAIGIGTIPPMAGLGLSDRKSTARRDHAHRNRLQNLY